MTLQEIFVYSAVFAVATIVGQEARCIVFEYRNIFMCAMCKYSTTIHTTAPLNRGL